MNNNSLILISVLILFFLSTISVTGQEFLDLSNPHQNLEAFVKTRASIDGNEVVFWWSGTIYSFIPGDGSEHLFNFEGFSVAKVQKVDQGYILLSREVSLYKDPDNDEIIDVWANTITGKKNHIIHVWNDPVNQKLFLQNRFGFFKVPTTLMGDDLYWNFEVFLNYPSPLPKSKYSKYSGSDEYQAAELFQYYTKLMDIMDSDNLSVPCQISWNRISPWLPWMEMGDRTGYLVYSCHGKKLDNGFTDLPHNLREYVLTNQPKFQHAPEKFSEPNETSWTYFKKMLQQGKIKQPPSAPKFK